jgi:LacI family transcriptional regulator
MSVHQNSRRPTIRDVAAEAKVSISTVSLFMRGLAGVSTDTGQRIAAAIEKLNYSPRRRLEPVQAHRFFGMLIEQLPLPAFSDIFYGQIIRALEAQAKAYGYGLLFSIVADSQIPRMVTDNQVGGVLILGGSPTNDALAAELVRRGTPLVLVDNYVSGLAVNCVVPDNEGGGALALQHLIDLGHRRIAIIEGPPKYKTLTDRLRGALRAAEAHGLPIPAEYRQESLSKGRSNKGYLEMKQLLSLAKPPTAVFAISDKTAFGALEAIKEAGLKVPDDISIIGFDDVADATPPLTTIHVPKYQMGILAMQQLFKQVNREAEVPVRSLVYTSLVVRQSTAPPSTEG